MHLPFEIEYSTNWASGVVIFFGAAPETHPFVFALALPTVQANHFFEPVPIEPSLKDAPSPQKCSLLKGPGCQRRTSAIAPETSA
eukprot:8176386-Pyramimonas_sp.AAC.1